MISICFMRISNKTHKIKKEALKNIRKQRKKYPALLEEIISQSDIILEILDARFPEKTRNKEIEKQIESKNKKLIYVLNKSDLTIKKPPLSLSIFVSCKNRKGIRRLREQIKIQAKKIKKDKIVVGVIGYPNTGKSSLINVLIGKSSARTGAEAGFTKAIQKLKLDSNIVLLDSPGVIPEKEYSGIQKEKIAEHTLVGGRSYAQVKEPDLVIAKLIKEYPNVLEKFYKINAKGNSEILIEELGKKKGFRKKRGEVNEDKTSRYILKDWQTGKIKI